MMIGESRWPVHYGRHQTQIDAGETDVLAGRHARQKGGEGELHAHAYRAFLGHAPLRLPTHRSPLCKDDAAVLATLAGALHDPLRFVDLAVWAAARLGHWIERDEVTTTSTTARDSSGDGDGDGDDARVETEFAPGVTVEHAPLAEKIIQGARSAAPMSALPQELLQDYAIFTRRFDEITDAGRLAPAEDLDRLRARLDGEMLQYQHWIARLARRLQRHIQARQCRWWSLDEEEGQLDPSRLSRVITDIFFETASRPSIGRVENRTSG